MRRIHRCDVGVARKALFCNYGICVSQLRLVEIYLFFHSEESRVALAFGKRSWMPVCNTRLSKKLYMDS